MKKDKMRKVCIFCLVACLTALASTGCGDGGAEENVTLSLGHVMAEDSTLHADSLTLKEFVEKDTEGTVIIDIFPSSGLGSEIQTIEGMMAGTVDCSFVTASSLANFVSDFGVFDLPYLVNGYDHAKAVWESEIGQALESKLKEQGLLVAAFCDFGFRNATNSVRPIETPADVKGLKMRVMQSEIPLDTWNTLGAETVAMAINEVFSALQTGVIDGQENPVTAIKSNSFFEVQKYLSLTEHQYNPIFLIMSRDSYDKLSEEQKAAFDSGCAEMEQFSVKDMEERTERDLKALKDKGMAVNEVDKSAFQTAVEPVIRKYYDVFGEAAIEKIRDLE